MLEIPGFHGDLNETYPVGRIDEDSERLIRTARKCLDESIKVCKPGALIRDIGKVMWVQDWESMRGLQTDMTISSEPIARANGCSSVRTYTGHGINDMFHCTPNVPHYAKNKAVGSMKAGMVRGQLLRKNVVNEPSTQCFTIEPVRSDVIADTDLS
jgi:methionyl aminopeptidase